MDVFCVYTDENSINVGTDMRIDEKHGKGYR
jgi:hypothetical protein